MFHKHLKLILIAAFSRKLHFSIEVKHCMLVYYKHSLWCNKIVDIRFRFEGEKGTLYGLVISQRKVRPTALQNVRLMELNAITFECECA